MAKGPTRGLEGVRIGGPGDRDNMEQGEKTKETTTGQNDYRAVVADDHGTGTRQYSSSGIPSTCRWKAIGPHWKAESLGAPKPWNWSHIKSKGGLIPAECRLCLDFRSLPRTERLGISLYPVLDGSLQNSTLPKAESLSLSPKPGHHFCPPPAPPPWLAPWLVLSAQYTWSSTARRGTSLHRWYYHF